MFGYKIAPPNKDKYRFDSSNINMTTFDTRFFSAKIIYNDITEK